MPLLREHSLWATSQGNLRTRLNVASHMFSRKKNFEFKLKKTIATPLSREHPLLAMSVRKLRSRCSLIVLCCLCT